MRGLLDELWYVETPRQARERRLLRRHVRGGRTESQAWAFIASSERVNARRVEASRPRCTRTIPPTDPFRAP